jgi:hypothetical protein
LCPLSNRDQRIKTVIGKNSDTYFFCLRRIPQNSETDKCQFFENQDYFSAPAAKADLFVHTNGFFVLFFSCRL